MSGGEQDPDGLNTWGQVRQARAQLTAAGLFVNHPAVERLIAERVGALPKDRHRLDDKCVESWVAETETALRACLASIPMVEDWPWLVTKLLGSCSGAAIRDLHKRSKHPGVPNALMDAVEAAARPILEDAAGVSHLTRSLQGVGAAPWYETLEGRSTGAALAALDAAHELGRLEILRYSTPPTPRVPKRSDADIPLWVGWWYRHDVSGERWLSIARGEYGNARAETTRHYVAEKAQEIRGLLSR
ncbi:MAG: hypothetical protein ABSA21_07040 [Candidatus Limnocylindrales bacterium]